MNFKMFDFIVCLLIIYMQKFRHAHWLRPRQLITNIDFLKSPFPALIGTLFTFKEGREGRLLSFLP